MNGEMSEWKKDSMVEQCFNDPMNERMKDWSNEWTNGLMIEWTKE